MHCLWAQDFNIFIICRVFYGFFLIFLFHGDVLVSCQLCGCGGVE